MMRALAAATLLLALGACGSTVAKTAPRTQALPPAPPPPPMVDDGTVCATDVKPCSDGSYVSRNPANGCAFDVCPSGSRP
jgi:hypothetical protein